MYFDFSLAGLKSADSFLYVCMYVKNKIFFLPTLSLPIFFKHIL